MCWLWWYMPALRRLRQGDFVLGQPGLHSENLSQKKNNLIQGRNGCTIKSTIFHSNEQVPPAPLPGALCSIYSFLHSPKLTLSILLHVGLCVKHWEHKASKTKWFPKPATTLEDLNLLLSLAEKSFSPFHKTKAHFYFNFLFSSQTKDICLQSTQLYQYSLSFGFAFFFILVVLEFELRASCLLGSCSTT
jgi:hypothetical protein